MICRCVDLVWECLCFLYRCFLLQIWENFSHNFIKYIFNLLSPPGTLIMQMLVHLMLSQWLLRVSLFLLFFLYSALLQLFPLFYLPAHLSVFLPQIVFYLFFLVYFKSQLLCCLLLIVYSLSPLGPG